MRFDTWIAIAANIGVVIGLVILVFEVRQNAELTRLSIEISKNDLFADIEFNLSNQDQASAWNKSYRAPETLTEIEIRKVESIMVAMLMQWDYMFQMEAAGLITEERVRIHISNAAPLYFGSRFAKAWFEREMQFWQGTKMHEVALPIVMGLDPSYMRDHYDALMSDARGEAE